MKKLFLFISILCFSFISAQSDKGDFTLAPQLGVNLSTYYSDADFNMRTSFAAGVIGEYYFNDRWSLRSGFLYDPMGAEDAGNNIDKLNYLTIPINANWHFGSGRNWYLNFGLGLSFLLNAEGELADGSTLDIKDSVPNTDIGLILGIGYKFDISDNFQLSIDYQGFGGFTELDDVGNLPFDIRNTRSAFNIGGVFKL